jgi:bifunctional non-homologous end joining protein LigD
MRPMLASRGTSVPTGPGWIHEVKWDGMRVLVEVHDGAEVPVRIWSRNENEVTVSFPELHAPPVPGHGLLLDGEVVAFDDGIPRFGALADRLHVGNAARAARLAQGNPVTLIVFDLLRHDGEDLTGRPLSVRRSRLESLRVDGPHWQVPPAYDDGAMLLSATEQQGLEGVVSKRLSSTYRFGQRSKDWLKFPHRARDSYVVGGWRREKGTGPRLGAVMVGSPTPRGLSYRGRVGSGLTGAKAAALLERLEPLEAETSPFCDEVPRVDELGTTWVRPQLVVEIASLGVTGGGRLRQPSFQGMRDDLAPGDLGSG